MQPAPWSPPQRLLRPPRQQPAIFGREERILLRDSMSAAYDHRTSEDWLASQTANSLGKSKLILTGDLFNTVTTAEHLKETLRSFLGHRTNLKALWIHDARGGWHPIAVARGWMLDGFGELESLAQCGISQNSGLWIDRWRSAADGAGDTHGEHQMLLCETLSKTYAQDYVPADLDAVNQAVDGASLLYMPGGNPFTLLEALRSELGSQVWAHAKARIDSGDLVVLTRSAGTIVVGATVDVSTERPEGWSGDPTGLCLPPAPLAFIPHYHLPQQQWIRHSKEWRESTSKGQWCKEDFLAALDASFRSAEWKKLAYRARVGSAARGGAGGRASAGSEFTRLAAAAAADRAEDEARRRLIRGVPLREGSFVAFDGAAVTCHQGPKPEALPGWLAAQVRQCEGAFWGECELARGHAHAPLRPTGWRAYRAAGAASHACLTSLASSLTPN